MPPGASGGGGGSGAAPKPAEPEPDDLAAGLPPGEARQESAEPLPGRAAAPPLQAQGSLLRRRARRRGGAWQRVRRSPYFRRGLQCSAGTALVMAVASIPAVWGGLSLDPALANPSIILVGGGGGVWSAGRRRRHLACSACGQCLPCTPPKPPAPCCVHRAAGALLHGPAGEPQHGAGAGEGGAGAAGGQPGRGRPGHRRHVPGMGRQWQRLPRHRHQSRGHGASLR